jgi:hypothetical protein
MIPRHMRRRVAILHCAHSGPDRERGDQMPTPLPFAPLRAMLDSGLATGAPILKVGGGGTWVPEFQGRASIRRSGKDRWRAPLLSD